MVNKDVAILPHLFYLCWLEGSAVESATPEGCGDEVAINSVEIVYPFVLWNVVAIKSVELPTKCGGCKGVSNKDVAMLPACLTYVG